MLFDSNYDVPTFLKKYEDGDFDAVDASRHTPPQKSHRENVFACVLDK